MKKFIIILMLPMFFACSRDELSESTTSKTSDVIHINDSNQNIIPYAKEDLENVYTLNQIDNLINEEFKDYEKVENINKPNLFGDSPKNSSKNTSFDQVKADWKGTILSQSS
jgi:hypothetical protein